MKRKIYLFLKNIGFFAISRFLYRKKLLILTYHGFEIKDECSCIGDKLFIKGKTLKKRMSYLKENKFYVLSLDDALGRLSRNERLPNNSVVITVDDGWYSTLSCASVIFDDFSYPYTIYISSYYAKKEIHVLNVVLRYIVFACKNKILEIPLLSDEFDFSDLQQRIEAGERLLEYFEQIGSTEEKLQFVEDTALLLGVDYSEIKTRRLFDSLNMSEIKQLAEQGVDIQLHTHRHRMSSDKDVIVDKEIVEQEIYDNKECLKPYVVRDLTHFCYPSGVHDNSCEHLLKKNGVISATTCESGFVSEKTNRYYLPRFLDGESVSQIEFEAELCGVADIFRKIRSAVW